MIMDHRIITSGQPANIFGNLQAGFDRGRQRRQVNALAQYGAGAVQGDQNAINALSAINPQLGMNIQSHRQMMDHRDLQMQSAQQQMGLRRNEAQRQQIRDAISLVIGAQTPEQWDQIASQRSPELVGRFAEKDEILRQLMSVEQRIAAALPEDESAAEQKIRRTMDAWNVDRATAQGIVDGVIVTSRDPMTGAATLINKATGVSGVGSNSLPEQPTASAKTPAPGNQPYTFGQQFENADQAGGLGGFVRGALNTGADIIGADMPFPETEQAQRDFATFGEGIVNAFASAYGRQPPSWLLQNIADLAPRPGLTEGPERSQQKLSALGRELQTRRDNIAGQLNNRRMRPNTRNDLEGQLAGVNAAISQISQALGGFDSGPSTNTTSGGVQWRVVE